MDLYIAVAERIGREEQIYSTRESSTPAKARMRSFDGHSSENVGIFIEVHPSYIVTAVPKAI